MMFELKSNIKEKLRYMYSIPMNDWSAEELELYEILDDDFIIKFNREQDEFKKTNIQQTDRSNGV